jgi:hypothetical protein
MFGTEFWAGVVLGGVVGIPAGLATNQMQRWMEARKRQKRRKVERQVSINLATQSSSGAWSLGKLHAKIHLFEVVLEGYNQQHFKMNLEKGEPTGVDAVLALLEKTLCLGNELPQAIEKFNERETYWADCSEQTIPHAPTVYDNNDLVVLDRFTFTRRVEQTTDLEVPSFQCSAHSGSYIAHRAAVDVFASLSDDLKKRICLFEREKVPFFGLNTAVSIALISSDQRLVFGRRKNLAVDPDKIVCGIGEGLRKVDVAGEAFDLPGPWRAALRGLKEEYGLSLCDRAKLKITAFCRSEEFYEFYFIGHIDLRECDSYSVGKIKEHLSQATMIDKYETSDILDCELTPEGIASFMASHGDEITEYGKVAACLALLAIDPNQRGALELALNKSFDNTVLPN